ncbi:MAG TPA: 3-oxoacyl-[acyl-carrier-protein] synthase III C-terminal domain-containing protein [Roseiflexaceae bacterium]|nr:3-oxoacyl-[acyl-carrier-protein] synthase III C-terminal domain-containing protein [Roseiflexaceae bacterium]
MPVIRSVATALPPHALAQERIRDLAREHFAPAFPEIDRYMSVFRHARIDTRHFAAPLEWFMTPHSFRECNDLFVEVATELGEAAARACLVQAGLDVGDVDHLIWVSTTGMAAPSPDAMLINRLGLGRHTRRTPIWGLGCAGGVAGLARAYEYAQAFPDQRVLLLSAELCSVTFQWNDRSKRNLIASSIFADGAAAVLVEGDTARGQAASSQFPTAISQLLGTQSTLWPDTLDIMGWDMVDTGMQVVFSSRIPYIVQTLMRENVAEFLAPYGLGLDDIEHWILHPGGAKVIDAYQAALAIDPERLEHTRTVLRQYGNMSSATVFFVLDAFLKAGRPGPDEYGVLAVLGPGFSCELALIRG